MGKENLTGKWAVVTGASSGIGLCFCRRLAELGCGLVMVSNQDCLDDCAAGLAAASGVPVRAFFCDLTAPDCAESILAFLDAEGIEADFLVNNAGIFSFNTVAATSERRIDCFVDLHIRAVTSLSRAFAIRFAARGRGRILNMSSMSCWMPMPGLAMYAATKAYIRVFSRSLHYETIDRGVTVTVACPGGIATDLFGLPERLKRFAVSIGVLMTPEKFARKAVSKMLKGKKQYINGWLNRVSIVAVAATPTWLRMQVKRRMLDKGIGVK